MTARSKLLAQNPLFKELSPSELESIDKLFVEVFYPKGRIICEVGDVGDSFYVILSGELAVYGRADLDYPTMYLGRGDFFGEVALMLGGRRTARIVVSRRATLLMLDKEAFDRFFVENPKALLHLSRELCQRLANVQKGTGARKATTSVAVAAPPGLIGTSLVATSLARLLSRMTRRDVLLVRARVAEEGGPPDHPSTRPTLFVEQSRTLVRREKPGDPVCLDLELDASLGRQGMGERLSDVLAEMSEEFAYMVFDLDARSRALAQSADEFSDHFVEIAESATSTGFAPVFQPTKRPRIHRVVNLQNQVSLPIPISECDPYVLPVDSSYVGRPADLAALEIEADPFRPISRPLHRLTRKILGASVGLALGGGAAFGLSHIGVIKVLEENGIPIDLISGCSMGSMVALGYAAGVSVEELVEVARNLGQREQLLQTTLFDFTLKKPGFFGGDRILKFFSSVVGDVQRFEQLALPCKAIATDIQSGERISIGTGRLDAAFRASSAVPMVWSPSRQGHRILVDGGVVDPVPAEVVRQMGADIVIAVNVIPPLKVGVETIVARVTREMKRFNPITVFGSEGDLSNTFDIIMNSMQVLQYELGNYKASDADVLISPDLRDYTWIDFHKHEELIEKGVHSTRSAMTSIRETLATRLAKAGARPGPVVTVASVAPAPTPAEAHEEADARVEVTR